MRLSPRRGGSRGISCGPEKAVPKLRVKLLAHEADRKRRQASESSDPGHAGTRVAWMVRHGGG